MASPDQTPPEENIEDNTEANAQQSGNEMGEPAMPPLFEFPPSEAFQAEDARDAMAAPPQNSSERTVQASQPTQPAPITRVLPEEGSSPISSAPSTRQEPVNEEAVRKGLVYPPPPSYYQNMPDVSTPPVLPQGQWQGSRQQPLPPFNAQPAAGHTSHTSQSGQMGAVPPQVGAFQPPQLQAGQQRQPGQFGQEVPPGYVPYPPYPPYQRRPAVKKSRRWLWITLSIIGVVLLASCGLCGWAAYNFFSPAVQSVTNSLNVVEDYYSALQAKNYAAAFDDISTQSQLSGLTEAQFAKEASARDTQYGAIQSYNAGNPAYTTDPNGGFNFTHFTYSVSIKRPNLSYTTTLSLSSINNQWKITNFDSV